MQLRAITVFDDTMQVLSSVNAAFANNQENHAIFERDNICIALINDDKIYLDLSCAYYTNQDEKQQYMLIVAEIEYAMNMRNLIVVIINDDTTLCAEYESCLETALFREHV